LNVGHGGGRMGEKWGGIKGGAWGGARE
jgi:hypothetical protein